MSAASPPAASADHGPGTPATGPVGPTRRIDPIGAAEPAGPINPRTGRPAGRFEGAILLACACMSVLAAVLMAPNLPRIQEAFATTPGVEILTPMVVTLPALMVGLTALVAGRIVDRVGRQRLLVVSLVLYAVAGTAPLWLPTLPLVVGSRVLVGLCEAAIMTCCTTLLADYFHGHTRERYFGYQVMTTTIAATVLFGLGGALGASSWRTPFWLYAVAAVLAVLCAVFLFNPAHTARPEGDLTPVPWRSLLAPIGVTFLGGLVFYVLIVELSYRLVEVGVTSPAQIGLFSAIASVGTAAGSFTFTRIAGRGPAVTVPLAFGLSGVGLLGMGLAPSLALLVPAAVVTGFGNGLLLPSLLTWALTPLTAEQHGRGTGLWTSASFLGNFVCPIVVIALGAALGGLGPAVAAVGLLALAVGLGVRWGRRSRAGAAAVDAATAPGVAH
ncbi:MFS transporter [Agilicoccus flavus]|uniref:MFS transporter n=1 Tax=Agilicoccus flavus TaxID=2775968 RepID=UPI001CF6294A|nr:MFS transporter [Agilicoccus flavus]